VNAIRTWPPNPALELTPLRGPKIDAILKVGFVLIASRSIRAAQLSASRWPA